MSAEPDLYDLEAAELDRDVRRANVASTYAAPPQPDELAEYAIRKVEEERFLAGRLIGAPRARHGPLIAEGLGFLQKLLSDVRPSAHPNLAVMSRFQRLLIERGERRRKPTAEDRARLRDYSAMDALELIPIPWKFKVTVSTAEVITKMAVTANCTPAAVAQILLCYGLEHLTDEIRARGAAPPPKIPNRKPLPASATAEEPANAPLTVVVRPAPAPATPSRPFIGV